MAAMKIKNRRELFDYFQDHMENTYSSLSEDQELEHKQNLLKTFVLESNIDIDYFKRVFNIHVLNEIDDHLIEFKVKNNNLHFYLDYGEPRFWHLYTLEESGPVKQTIKKFMDTVKNGLDHLWFPIDFQREMSELGIFRGLGVKYKANEVFTEEFIENNLSFGDLSIRTWGPGTKNLFETLDKSEELKNFLSISSIGIKREVENAFVLEDINYNAQFTTRGGSSIQLHLDTLDQVIEKYNSLLRKIEEDYRISYKIKENSASIQGSPIVIELGNEIEDIEQFLERVVSSKNPFRLWGLRVKLEEDYYKVKGIDLHNGDKITLEVSPNWIRLYLPSNACGNTVLRIFVNIQHYYDSSARMEVL